MSSTPMAIDSPMGAIALNGLGATSLKAPAPQATAPLTEMIPVYRPTKVRNLKPPKYCNVQKLIQTSIIAVNRPHQGQENHPHRKLLSHHLILTMKALSSLPQRVTIRCNSTMSKMASITNHFCLRSTAFRRRYSVMLLDVLSIRRQR